MTDLQRLRLAGLLGTSAAAAAALADLALQYTGNAAHLGSKEYLYLLDVPPSRLLIGHFVGVAAILLEIVGFWLVAQGLAPAGERKARAFFLISATAYGVGAAFHAMFAVIGLALREVRADGNEELLGRIARAVRPVHEGLGTVTLLGIVALSILFSVIVWRRGTLFPRWMAFLSPLPMIVGLAVVSRLVPALRLYLLPCGINLCNLVFFALATSRLWNRDMTFVTADS
ncbi:MAG TPA: DUF6796 family protein [Thermoanaerobaculia bacterium]|nr:DUF6796 family protein [Thermoanaerobaculia bacterium]